MVFSLGVFDMDGVLIEEISSWVMVHRHFGVNNDISVEQYLRGEIDDFEFMRRDIALWKRKKHPLHVDVLKDILKTATIMPGAVETFRKLGEMGIKTVIVSGGLSCLAEHLAEKLGIDMVMANGVEVNEDGYLVGEGILKVPLNDKGSVVRDLREQMNLEKKEVFAVGNSHIDISMFRESGLGIAFNPADEEVRSAADIVIEERDLRRVLDFIS